MDYFTLFLSRGTEIVDRFEEFSRDPLHNVAELAGTAWDFCATAREIHWAVARMTKIIAFSQAIQLLDRFEEVASKVLEQLSVGLPHVPTEEQTELVRRIRKVVRSCAQRSASIVEEMKVIQRRCPSLAFDGASACSSCLS